MLDASRFIQDGVGQRYINIAQVTAGAADVLSGKKILDASGNIITGTIPSKSAATITPGTTNQTIAAGQYISGLQTILGDADLIAANIKNGVDIFGVTGTAKTVQGSYESGSITSGTTSPYTLTLTLAKHPIFVVFWVQSTNNYMTYVDVIRSVGMVIWKNGSTYTEDTAPTISYNSSTKVLTVSSIRILSGAFYRWYAAESD